MQLKTVKKILVTFCINHIMAGTVFFEPKRRLLNSIGCEIGEGTKVVGPIYNTGKLIVGKNCWLGKNLTVNGNGTVIIGDNCDIAPEVTFQTGGHKIGTAERRAGPGEKYTIEVGNGCWICSRATIVRSVRVGAGSVVAACACVTKDVESNILAGGVPAKTIRKLENDQEITCQ